MTMEYQLIVSTMNRTDDSLLDDMRITSDAIVINQIDRTGYREITRDDATVRWFDFNERGIGLSRHSGLMRAEGEIIQFADDDMEFTDTYREDVLKEYAAHPEADVILFSNLCLNPERMPYQVHAFGRVRRLEAVRFGGARITARREKLLYNNISFSLLFGGGARYCAGEDVTFIQDCIKAGLKVYKSPVILSTMRQEKSSWFDGYDDAFFRDKGALLAANFPVISRFGAFVQAYRHRGQHGYTFRQLAGLYQEGIREYLGKK